MNGAVFDPFCLGELPALDLDGLGSIFADDGDEAQAAAASRDAGATVPEGLIHKRRAEQTRRLNLLHVANAAKHLTGLPEPGESWHGVMSGNFDAWSFVPATIQLAGRPLSRLTVATLGFNANNARRLAEAMDGGDIRHCDLICSTYFQAKDAADTSCTRR